MNGDRVPVVVTTEWRGVFFGYVDAEHDRTLPSIFLTDAHMCIYWSEDVKGVFGLTGTGPIENCRIGPTIPDITLRGVTGVASVRAEAVIAWENAPWSR